MLGLSIPVYPARGQMWATAPVPPSIFHSIGALESHLYWHTHPYSDEQTPLELTHHLYGRQTGDGEITRAWADWMPFIRDLHPSLARSPTSTISTCSPA